ncbi:alpha/beta hydrolase [Haladaptatus sp. GCM10025707]|uniref:alpha/beta hydrolase n=1 Tax=unclassified Haladaptatus TaxID=2622732 RepID=UPI0023E7CB9B|nr:MULTISPECIES: alpha/beta hydrolase [unclassified Haladaptatus]
MRRRTDLDAQVREVLAEFEVQGIPPWHAISVEAARALEDELFSAGSGPEVGRVQHLGIPRRDGPGTIPIRTYHPDPAAPEDPPILVFYHGGLWAMGTLDSADDLARNLAARVGALLISVEYRLAPEHPFPAGLEDAYAAFEWAREHGASLGGDPARVGVVGSSSGGNLAAAVALWARDERRNVAVQGLLYPILRSDFETGSYEENADAPLLTRDAIAHYFDRYVRSEVDRAHPFVAPLLSADLSNVAPAVIVTAGHDPLRDDGFAYAERLSEAGVEVAHRNEPAMCHSFLSLADDVDRAAKTFEAVTAELRARL